MGSGLTAALVHMGVRSSRALSSAGRGGDGESSVTQPGESDEVTHFVPVAKGSRGTSL